MTRTQQDIQRDQARNSLRSKIIELYDTYELLDIVDIIEILNSVTAFEIGMLQKHYMISAIERDEDDKTP